MKILNQDDTRLIRQMADSLCPEEIFRRHMRRGLVYGRKREHSTFKNCYVLEGIVVPVQESDPLFVRTSQTELAKVVASLNLESTSPEERKTVLAVATYVPLPEYKGEPDSSKDLRRMLGTLIDYPIRKALVITTDIFSPIEYRRQGSFKIY